MLVQPSQVEKGQIYRVVDEFETLVKVRNVREEEERFRFTVKALQTNDKRLTKSNYSLVVDKYRTYNSPKIYKVEG